MRASSLPSYQGCPAKWAAEQHPDAIKDSTSAVAESGQAIHAKLEGQEIRELSVEEEIMAEKIKRQEQLIYSILQGRFGDRDAEHREIELELEIGGEKITGHPDLVWLFPGDVAAVVDYKTGRGKGTTAVESNLQLGWYALAVAQRFGKKRVVACIIEPAVSWDPMWVEYTLDDLRALFKVIKGIITYAKSEDGKQDFRPGKPQCDYCRFIHRCPGHQQNLQALALLDNNIGRWRELAPAERLEVFDRMRLAEKMISTLKRWFSAELNEDPDAYDGLLSIKRTPGNREVVDAVNIWNAVSTAAGVTPEEFAQCCKITLGKLQAAVGKGYGRIAESKGEPALKGANLKKAFDDLVEPYVRRKKESQRFVREGHVDDDTDGEGDSE